jgi:actin-like ATPase involved in cell morphogenesis
MAEQHYTLGIDLGTTFSAAAVHAGDRTQMVTLGHRSTVVPSVVFLAEDGTTVLGEAALRRGLAEPERVARQFKRRVGDSVPLILGGMPLSAEALSAALLRGIVDEVVEQRGGPPSALAVTHPANWGPFKLERLADILRMAEVGDGVLTLSEPEAAALSYAAAERVPVGTVLAVYDLGGGTFDASVLRKSATGFEVLGTPSGVEHLGGIDVDEAVFDHVARSLGDDLLSLPEGEATQRLVARLRSDCVDAKEALSADTQATVSVTLPRRHVDVRITRAELEAKVRPMLDQSVAALRRTIASAELEPADVDRVLLVGGSSRVPLVAELVAEAIGRPLVVDAHPKHATALGAARFAAQATGLGGVDVPPPGPVPGPGAATAATVVAAPPVVPAPMTEPVTVAEGPWAPPTAPLAPTVPAAPVTAVGVPPAGPQPGLPAADGPLPRPANRTPLLVAAALVVLAAIGAVAALAASGGDDDNPGANRVPITSIDDDTPASSEAPTTATSGTPTTAEPTTSTTRRTTTTTAPPQPVEVGIVGAAAPAEAATGNDACNNPTSYAATNMVDGAEDTAWRVDGDATGTTLAFDLGGSYRVLNVGLVPGYAKVDPCDGADRFVQNRRPTSVTWIFDDGTTVSQQLADAPDMQRVSVDAVSSSVQLRIDGVTGDPERDFTAISEVSVQGT